MILAGIWSPQQLGQVMSACPSFYSWSERSHTLNQAVAFALPAHILWVPHVQALDLPMLVNDGGKLLQAELQVRSQQQQQQFQHISSSSRLEEGSKLTTLISSRLPAA
jgi:hypothetical protein